MAKLSATASATGREEVQGWCALCRSRCGCVSVVEAGRLVALQPDPSHPTGAALCIKGRAAPELVHHPDRLTHPLKRTRPKGEADPGWVPIGWDEALDLAARELLRVREQSGAEAVAFAVTSPSGTALSDSIHWIERLIRAFGSPNTVYATEICNWHKDYATRFTFGSGLPLPDCAQAGCLLLWGFNPSTSWLVQAQAVAAARGRGAKLIVVDPRRVGLAAKADLWLPVRPGSDGALALAIAGVMIAEGRFDRDFVRRWTNGPLLVRDDDGRLLRRGDSPVAWDEAGRRPVLYDPAARRYDDEGAELALDGEVTLDGVRCRPAFALYAALCRDYEPETAAAITGVPAEQIRAAARLIHESGPLAYYAWTGVGQHTNATQTDRAIALLAALTGSFDAPGGNVLFDRLPAADVSGAELLPAAQRAKALGLAERPLGPPASGWVTAADFYRAVLTRQPYAVRALVGFGANLLLSHAAPDQAAQALGALDFYLHTDLFLTPTARFADLVLPVTTPWEHEGLRIGFEVDNAAEELVQLRRPVLPPQGEARPDAAIVFDLARRLGLGAHFWDGDLDAGHRARLAPSGIGLEQLRAAPAGLRRSLRTRYRKYRESGFDTPSGKVEIYAEQLLAAGQPPLPAYREPAMSPRSRPDLAADFPLVLTCSKLPRYCHSQHRGLPSLRRGAPQPTVELHPSAAAARGIAEGDRVELSTPKGRAVMVASLNSSLAAGVVSAQHGWWQACDALGLPGYDPLSPDGANYNGLIGNEAADPVSGSVPLRSYLCELRRCDGA